MLVSSDANAAQSRAPGEATRFFDDIGCLAGDKQAHADGVVRYVHLETGDWASTESAWFAISRDARTPMDHGILAFASRDEAQGVDRADQARGWPAIVSHVEAP
jgi:hypothetical protein